ncbi:ketol-acid reductoisomerase [Candidatus Bathyarchaeota archaeon RBG_13_60_20]|jgi:ketol-acid reductoisomerase|nr:MAG: ketol-acid reductoisomerase [Candidatus Bathyarchaeota archaeon RBG_13_60_20]
MVKVYHDKDIDESVLKGKTVAVLGYGSQGRAQALNLRDSGTKVLVGLRPGGKSWKRAQEDGFKPVSHLEAAQRGDVVLMLMPDMAQPSVYKEEVSLAMKPGKALQFAHGFNIHFGEIKPPKDVDVIMVAPKSPGPEMRRQYEAGFGVPALVAVHQDASGHALEKALAVAKALGSGRAGVIETTYKDETESDLFGEQAVLCGGVDQLIRRGFKVLTEAGYPPELAYFEVCNELKLIVDLIYKSGLGGMYRAVSDTAKWGGMSVGPMIVDDHVEDNMRRALKAVRDGSFAKAWIAESKAGAKRFEKLFAECDALEIEKVGRQVRRMSGLEK